MISWAEDASLDGRLYPLTEWGTRPYCPANFYEWMSEAATATNQNTIMGECEIRRTMECGGEHADYN